MKSNYKIGDKFKYFNHNKTKTETIEIVSMRSDEFVFESKFTPSMTLSKIKIDDMIEKQKLNIINNYFPDGSFVKAKRSGGKRYVTRQTNKECFEDDGKISGQKPSIFCHNDNYELIQPVTDKTNK